MFGFKQHQINNSCIFIQIICTAIDMNAANLLHFIIGFKYSHTGQIVNTFRRDKNQRLKSNYINVFPSLYGGPNTPMSQHDTQRFIRTQTKMCRLILLRDNVKTVEYEMLILGNTIANLRPKSVNSIYQCVEGPSISRFKNFTRLPVIKSTNWENEPFTYNIKKIHYIRNITSISFYVILTTCVILIILILFYYYQLITKYPIS